MTTRYLVWSIALGALGLGCTGTPEPTEQSQNEILGIVRFVVEESPDRTSVVGLDAVGELVGRLELVHGRFTLSPPFTEDYETPDIDGRKLTVEVLGQQLRWETAGYDPVLQMPAQPPSQWAIASFLDDPHTAAVLDRWQIGFETFRPADLAGGERAYGFGSGSYRGENPQTCDGQSSCGTAYYGTINTCGGGATATDAARVTQRQGSNCGYYSSSYDQVLLSQCCPSGSGGQSTDWFAQKACNTTSTGSHCDPDGGGPLGSDDGRTTSCGCQKISVACKACPSYPDAADVCDVHIASGIVGTCGIQSLDVDVYQLQYDYDCAPSCQ